MKYHRKTDAVTGTIVIGIAAAIFIALLAIPSYLIQSNIEYATKKWRL